MKIILELIAAAFIAVFLAIGVSKAEPMTLTESELGRVTAGYPGMSLVQSLVELNHYGFYLNPINIAYNINRGILTDYFFDYTAPPPALTSEYAINRFGY